MTSPSTQDLPGLTFPASGSQATEIRLLSLWQPWASAVALGSKRVETRSWCTGYRGRLAIHAAKRCVVDELIDYRCTWNWKGALRGTAMMDRDAPDWKTCLPFGAIVAVCDLVDCRPTGSFTGTEIDTLRMPPEETLDLYGWTERQMGDFSLGRFGWVLENIQPLAQPLPFKGAQGLRAIQWRENNQIQRTPLAKTDTENH